MSLGLGGNALNILVTIDENYVKPLKIMLASLFRNTPAPITVYLLHSKLTAETVDQLQAFVGRYESKLIPLKADNSLFQEAPLTKHYTVEMYYRLLAYQFLPADVEKILYLDPDILVINDLTPLYEMPLAEQLFAAAHHDIIGMNELNKLRFLPYEIENYYNTGVLLMNVAAQRQRIEPEEIFDFVEEHGSWLALPDQDVLNALYAHEVVALDELKYNYDARKFRYYQLKTLGEWPMERVAFETALLHFCGKNKPWQDGYTGLFHALYQHYHRLMVIDESKKA